MAGPLHPVIGGGPMLHKTMKIRGFHLCAIDGHIGHIDDFLIDEDWGVRYLVVDTSNWLGGKAVLIPSEFVDVIDAPKREVRVKLTKEEIKNSPSIDTAEIEL